MTPDIEKLTALVEATTGPDTELDGTLWWSMYLSAEQRKREDPFGTIEAAIQRYGSAGEALNQFFSSSDPHCLARRAFQQPFTSSIDAALALTERLLPGFEWTRNMDDVAADGTEAVEIAWREDDKSDWIIEEGRAHSTPLAIILATLRAYHAGETP